MNDFFAWAMTAAWALLTAAGAPSGPAVPIRGCPPEAAARLRPYGGSPGPLRLSQIACIPLRFGSGAMVLSPDGAAAVRWQPGTPGLVEIATLDRPARVAVATRVTFRNLARLTEFASSPDALAWAGDSQSLWSVRQPTAQPSGF